MKRKAILVLSILVILSVSALSQKVSAENGDTTNSCVLHGKVVDEEGVPVEEALVIIDNRPYFKDVYFTDATGRYDVANIPPARYNITIIKEGYITEKTFVELKAGENIYSVTLTKPKPKIPAHDIIIFILACLGATIIIIGGIFIRKEGVK